MLTKKAASLALVPIKISFLPDSLRSSSSKAFGDLGRKESPILGEYE